MWTGKSEKVTCRLHVSSCKYPKLGYHTRLKKSSLVPKSFPPPTQAPMLGESFVGGIAEATFLLNKLLQVKRAEVTLEGTRGTRMEREC